MKRNKHLIFMCGGGSAGHIVPNLTIAKELKKYGIKADYIGRPYGMEFGMAEKAGMDFHNVNSGRVFRHFDWDMFKTPFRVMQGTVQTIYWVLKYRPSVIFCKGGFMAWPAALGGWLTYTPVVLHESDMTPGLANRMCIPFANRICTTFEETLKYLPKGQAVYTGSPIREEIAMGSREKGFELTGLDPKGKPVLMVVGGSLGAAVLNEAVDKYFDELSARFQIVHLYGVDTEFAPPRQGSEGYCVFQYAREELADLFAMSDIILSRAGANAINEFLMLKKPHVLVPLPAGNSRGDQVLNAEEFARQGFSYVLPQDQMNEETLMKALDHVYENRETYIKTMSSGKAKNGTKEVVKVIRRQIAKLNK